MVTSNDLCCALEELLAIQYDKMYRTWQEYSIIDAAKVIAKRYRDETGTLPSTNSLNLKAPEAVSYEEGMVQEFFDTSEPTDPHVVLPESFSSIPSEVDHELVDKLVLLETLSQQIAAYNAMPH